VSDERTEHDDDTQPVDGAGEDMHIHRPKPLHGWREITTEIGIIVVGIAIAIAGEQAVEALDWGHKVAQARQGLSVELGEDLGQGEHRVRAGPCVERRLDELAAVVDDAARTGQLPPLGVPGLPNYFTWDTGLWRSVVSAQTSAHMRREELKAYTAAYEFIERIDTSVQREEAVWTTLYGLAGPGRRFDAAEAATYRQAIGEARYLDRVVGGDAVRARQIVQAWGLTYDQRKFHRYADWSIASLPVCKPLENPPPHYGAAPLENFAAAAQANPITADSKVPSTSDVDR
jgi:hypothetical protein